MNFRACAIHSSKFVIFFLLMSAIAACAQPSSKKKSPEVNQDKTDEVPVVPVVPVVPTEEIETPQVSIEFVFIKDDQEPITTAESINDIFQVNCVSCHSQATSANINDPDLSKIPFKNSNNDSIEKLGNLILERMEDSSKPMPPSGNLSTDTIDRVKEWKKDGFKSNAQVAIEVERSAYKFEYKKSTDAKWLLFQDKDNRMLTNFADSEVGSEIGLDIRVLGPKSSVVFEESIPWKVDRSMSVKKLTFQILEEDSKKPKLLYDGAVKLAEESNNRAKLKWEMASDNRTSADELEYLIKRCDFEATFQDQCTVEDATAQTEWIANLDQFEFQKSSSVNSLLFVLVRDKMGNQSLYKPVYISLDKMIPQVGALEVIDMSARSFTLSWSPAEDQMTPANKLEYKVISSYKNSFVSIEMALQEADVVSDWQKSLLLQNITGLNQNQEYFVTVLVRDMAGNMAMYPAAKIVSVRPSLDNRYDINDHGEMCGQRLGYLKAFSCLEGEIIPITVGGHVPQQGYPEFADGGSRDLDCDRPALLGLGSDGRCPPFARLGRLKSYDKQGNEVKDTETVFICRRYVGRFGMQPWQGAAYDAKVFPGFEDVAIIQHSPKTGETCYFQMLSSKDARRVPAPHEKELPADAPDYAESAKDFWLSPRATANINCNNCHDADAWIHTPHVDQVVDQNGEKILPSHPFGKYSVIGPLYFADWNTNNTIDVEREPGERKNQCVECHRMGAETCSTLAPQSIGEWRSTNLSTYAMNTFNLSHWMPPEHRQVNNQNDFDNDVDNLKSDWEEIQNCCQNPSADGCKITRVRTPPPLFVQ